ncbi:MAG: TetR/AcrR family transcriptional regulator [Proteobacteria bacterium]|nr:TetR/AcrR family transcriptional regulator [Pseudomonadota bacterium]
MYENSKFSKLKEGEREARKEILINAALDLFDKKPFDEIGVRDIAAAVGVSPASMYRYFPSREDLFVEAFIKDLRTIEKWLDKLIQDTEDFTMEAFATALVTHLLKSEPTFQMMSYLMIKGKMSPNLLKRYNNVQRSLLNKIDSVIDKAGIHTDNRLFSHVLYASLNGILMTFRNYPGRSKHDIEKHVHRLASLLCKIFRYGVASPLFDELSHKTKPQLDAH